ncbi:pre-mRNA-splicing factor 38B [Quillaja saponaria]|uniref:Pre-mRNA-splicing factor 38B n=1 Tax=Quillaja saponaria TaxID=32244 RepID=A0AAD7PDG0_QUISA|nr:pre-mRNA-splicing factor 38B [Quillaja saponaria]
MQYYFDTLFPRIPVPVLRQVVSNLEKVKLPTTHSGTTGDCNRHSSDATARQPPSVKAALSVSFGQCAPHRASTRDSSPVCCTVPPPSHGRSGNDDLRRSPSSRSQSREYPVRDRDRDRSMIQIDTGNMTGIEIWTGTDSGIGLKTWKETG